MNLADLDFLPYINTDGKLPEEVVGKIGVYAIFDQEKTLQFVGYSRDVYLSLKQHLVRRPDQCYWLKCETIDRPSKALLEATRDAWIAENGKIPVGNDTEQIQWQEPIDAKIAMTDQERATYQSQLIDEIDKDKLLKNVARRVEAEILSVLEARGVQEEIRFNPKQKTLGLLDLK